tara:strand:+ start:864 stop:1982 length:1119 start_codon:yes stop_codon:yes gene_type:complete
MSKQHELVQFSRGSATALGGGSKNLIINGGQQIWQRASATTTVVNGQYGTVDRWAFNKGSSGAYTSTRSTDVPSGQGFSYSNKLDVTTADTSVGASEIYLLKHRIEAQNLARLAYGTSGAKTITLSFWVKSNKTGTYTVALYKFDNTTLNYVREFSISAADTWEKKELTITPTAGSTTHITSSGGAIDVNNDMGLDVNFVLSLGSNYTGSTNDSWSTNGNHYGTTNNINWMDSTSNNFYITGVQLETNSAGVATDFEHEPYSATLAKCQRYFQHHQGDYYTIFLNGSIDTTSGYINGPLTQVMRAKPSFSTANCYLYGRPSGTLTYTSLENRCSTDHATMGFHGISGSLANSAGMRFESNDSNGYVRYDAEL